MFKLILPNKVSLSWSQQEMVFQDINLIIELYNFFYPGIIHNLFQKILLNIMQDLKTYLDNSKNGVIYVSLGTNVRTANMDKDLVDAFRDAFNALPYDVLWKFDEGTVNGVANNVKIQKWFPQRDLLGKNFAIRLSHFNLCNEKDVQKNQLFLRHKARQPNNKENQPSSFPLCYGHNIFFKLFLTTVRSHTIYKLLFVFTFVE